MRTVNVFTFVIFVLLLFYITFMLFNFAFFSNPIYINSVLFMYLFMYLFFCLFIYFFVYLFIYFSILFFQVNILFDRALSSSNRTVMKNCTNAWKKIYTNQLPLPQHTTSSVHAHAHHNQQDEPLFSR